MKNANKRDVMRATKTRFNSRDRSKEACSTYSPRLKSFPAEKIKKQDNPPMFSPDPIGDLMIHQLPRETETAAVSSARTHNGHGDAISTAQSSQVNQEMMPPSALTMNQQQVVANHQQIDRANAQSDSLLTRRVGLPERQAHRPYVPNVYQEAAIRDRSPRNPPTMLNQPMIIQAPPTQSATPVVPRMQQLSSDSHTANDQNRREADVFGGVECETQPNAGRNTANHGRQTIMHVQHQRPAQTAIVRDMPSQDRDACNCQNVRLQRVHDAHLHNTYQQIPQQIPLQQPQREVYHQPASQQVLDHASSMFSNQQSHNNRSACCDYCEQKFSAACSYSGQGMTSPQDLTVSRMKLMRRNLPVHQRDLRYPVNPQAAWPQDEGWTQAAAVRDQRQYCCQTQDARNSDYNRRSSESQVRSVPSTNRISYKPTNQQQSTVEAHNRQDGDRKVLQFTPDMIRDQELLVSTMRQQDVPDDVMRRQFDALLNEQRRHLIYVAQFNQEDISEMREKRINRPARRRMECDEKPEWMIHITPPRISYNEVERIRAQQRVSNGQSEEIGGAAPVKQQDFHQIPKEELINRTYMPQRCYETNPHVYQQQSADWSHQNNYQMSRAYVPCCSDGHQNNTANNPYHQQPNLYQYPHYVPCNPHQVRPDYQNTRSKEHTAASSKPIDNRTASNLASFYEQPGRTIEPCSLLKMRVYKEVIRPQKRNNGLQDPETTQKMLATLKDPTTRKGLEYLANLTKKTPTVRLNGVQEPDEISGALQQQPLPTSKVLQARCKKISANGLENGGSLGNRAPRALRPKRADEPIMMEYPRQKQYSKFRENVQAEKENGMTENTWRDSFPCARNAGKVSCDQQNPHVMQERRGDDPSFQHPCSSCYHQTQQCCSSGQSGGQGDVASMQRSDAPGAMRIDRAGGDTCENAEETRKYMGGAQSAQRTSPYGQPDIHETRTIDCVAHSARKPDYSPSDLVASSDKLMASRHLQPPRIL